MIIKDSVIYAESGETLVAGKSAPNASFIIDSFQTGIDCKRVQKLKVPGCEFLQYGPGITMFMPSDNTYESLYKGLVKEGYDSEEQFQIMLKKNNSDADAEAYDNLLFWMEFASKAAKLISPRLGIEINETLEEVKNEKLADITKYDTSSAVNSFIYNGMSLWLDKATRVGLMNSTAILQNAGKETTTLWLGTLNVTLPCTSVILMLSQIEMYALDCYNVTAEHKANVEKLETVEAVKAYDYTTGYPEKLVFDPDNM